MSYRVATQLWLVECLLCGMKWWDDLGGVFRCPLCDRELQPEQVRLSFPDPPVEKGPR